MGHHLSYLTAGVGGAVRTLWGEQKKKRSQYWCADNSKNERWNGFKYCESICINILTFLRTLHLKLMGIIRLASSAYFMDQCVEQIKILPWRCAQDKIIKIYPDWSMNISTRIHGNPSNSCWDISPRHPTVSQSTGGTEEMSGGH